MATNAPASPALEASIEINATPRVVLDAFNAKWRRWLESLKNFLDAPA